MPVPLPSMLESRNTTTKPPDESGAMLGWL
jgi:hypothetical protein